MEQMDTNLPTSTFGERTGVKRSILGGLPPTGNTAERVHGRGTDVGLSTCGGKKQQKKHWTATEKNWKTIEKLWNCISNKNLYMRRRK